MEEELERGLQLYLSNKMYVGAQCSVQKDRTVREWPFWGKRLAKKKKQLHNFIVTDLQGIKFGFGLGAMSW